MRRETGHVHRQTGFARKGLPSIGAFPIVHVTFNLGGGQAQRKNLTSDTRIEHPAGS